MTSDDKGPSARIYPPRLHFCLSRAHVIAGYSDQYELKVMDFDGQAVGTIRKKSDPVKLTPAMRDFIIDLQTSGRGYPEGWNVIELDHLPAYMNLSSDDQGRIYAGTFERPEGQPDHYYFDVFAPDGDFLTRFPLQMHDFRMPLTWKNNSLYLIDMNREEIILLKRWMLSGKTGDKIFYDVFDAEGRYIARVPLKASIFFCLWRKDKLYTLETDNEGYIYVQRYHVEWEFQQSL